MLCVRDTSWPTLTSEIGNRGPGLRWDEEDHWLCQIPVRKSYDLRCSYIPSWKCDQHPCKYLSWLQEFIFHWSRILCNIHVLTTLLGGDIGI